MFSVYSIQINGIPLYYGHGSDDYGDGRGRMEEHHVKLKMALNGKPKSEMYAYLVEKLKAGNTIEIKSHFNFSTKAEAVEMEERLISEHDADYGTPILNLNRGGKIYRPKAYEKLLSEEAPADGLKAWDFKAKLAYNEESARMRGFNDLADRLKLKREALKVEDNEGVNALMAYQRTVRLAKAHGCDDLARRGELERVVEKTIEEHRATVDLLNESRRIEVLLREPVPAEAESRYDYFEKLAYNERILTSKGYHALREKVSDRLYEIRKTDRRNGVKAKKANLDLIDRLKADPDLIRMTYAQLARKYGVSMENLARIMRLAGIEKPDARTQKRNAQKDLLLSDPDLANLTYAQLCAKHGLSRMTVIRYLAESGAICKSSAT